MIDPLLLLAEDKELITYRKSLNKITGSVTATILLQQILYWSKKEDHRPFYKFRSPCQHKLYKPGDSWTEELGFGLSEFDTALKRIGTKITKGANKAEAFAQTDSQGLVIYWTDSNRITWYHLNVNLLRKMANSIYLDNSDFQDTHEGQDSELPLTKTTPETTPETTPNGVSAPQKSTSQKRKAKTAPIKEKDPSLSKQMFSSLRKLCGYSEDLFPRGKLNSNEKKLRGAGVSPGELEGFGRWWYANDWRGQKGQPPIPSQVVECWGQYKNGNLNGASNGKTHQRNNTQSFESIQSAARERLARSRNAT